MTRLQSRPGTPPEALAELLSGNERFVTGARLHPHQDAERRAALVGGQRPSRSSSAAPTRAWRRR